MQAEPQHLWRPRTRGSSVQPRMLGLRGEPRTLEQLERTLQKDSPVGQQPPQKTEQPGPRTRRPGLQALSSQPR